MRLSLQRFGNRRGLLVFAVALLVLGAASIGVISTMSFSTVQVDRSVSADVVRKSQGYFTADVRDCVPASNRERERLVTVTSQLDSTAQLEVILNEPSIGTLHAQGRSGDMIRLNIDPGESIDVYLETTGRGPFPNEFTFDVGVSVSPVTFTETYKSKVDVPAPRGCGSAGNEKNIVRNDWLPNRKEHKIASRYTVNQL